jgi:hypothetical protein
MYQLGNLGDKPSSKGGGLAMDRSICIALTLFFLATPSHAQECKVKIAVAHWDGKALEIGLTADQSKFWSREKTNHYPTFCLDGTAPDFIIAWTERTSSDEIKKLTVRRGAGGSNPESVITVSAVQNSDSAHYFIFDLSKEPAAVIHAGSGAKSSSPVPERSMERQGMAAERPLDPSRISASVPDPADAMKNALDWLKKKH